jgi:prephenate dehydrogenase
MKVKLQKAVLIGVGLIGGSLSRDLLQLGLAREIVGFSRTPATLTYARRHGVITRIGRDLQRELADADLVILALPVATLLTQLPKVAAATGPRTLVIDVGSTKAAIVNLADRLFKHGGFVGCHPIAGKETSGVKASVAGLFSGRTTVITPGRSSVRIRVTQARALWRAVGARVVEMPAAAHDVRVALSSHLPQLMASTLMNAIGRRLRDPQARAVIGSGLRDTTRIAASDPAVWREILQQNRDNLLPLIAACEAALDRVKRALRSGDDAAVFRFMAAAARLRRGIR